MERTQEEILKELVKEVEVLGRRVSELEARLVGRELPSAGESAAAAAVELSIDDIMGVDSALDRPDAAGESAVMARACEQEPAQECLADIFGMYAEEETGTLNARHKPHQKRAVVDVMAADEAWRTDMPGSAVRNMLSAISLNDRILFIRSLFNDDPSSFSAMVEAVNSSASFDEAVERIKSAHPEWNYNSDAVYRFMMAARRRLR